MVVYRSQKDKHYGTRYICSFEIKIMLKYSKLYQLYKKNRTFTVITQDVLNYKQYLLNESFISLQFTSPSFFTNLHCFGPSDCSFI